jgi:hypothetical protein
VPRRDHRRRLVDPEDPTLTAPLRIQPSGPEAARWLGLGGRPDSSGDVPPVVPSEQRGCSARPRAGPGPGTDRAGLFGEGGDSPASLRAAREADTKAA